MNPDLGTPRYIPPASSMCAVQSSLYLLTAALGLSCTLTDQSLYNGAIEVYLIIVVQEIYSALIEKCHFKRFALMCIEGSLLHHDVSTLVEHCRSIGVVSGVRGLQNSFSLVGTTRKH